ncbi:MAG: hypothetical protein ISS33_00780 [Candidatus Omnitrophica bacterium]|nr:hypothetical protein [Candidatus Omnitrophota bacterium]
MREKLILLILLFGCVFVQIFFGRNFSFFPDMIVLAVVFAGIFFGANFAAWFGIMAGFLRGCFSSGPLFLDVFLFLAIGIVSSFLANKFYKYSPVVQAFIAAVAMFVLIAGHTLYSNLMRGSSVNILYLAAENWKMLGVTILFSPIFFVAIKKIVKMQV